MKVIKLRKPEKTERNLTYYNGVAIENITFPCLCTFSVWGEETARELGMLNCGYPDFDSIYTLHYVETRMDINRVGFDKSLLNLLERYYIRFEVGEIVFYDK